MALEDRTYAGKHAEIVIRSDSRAVWLNIDDIAAIRAAVESVSVNDQRQTTIEELFDALATEIRELALVCSQSEAANLEQWKDARERRRYHDSYKYSGRAEGYENMHARLEKIIATYKLRER